MRAALIAVSALLLPAGAAAGTCPSAPHLAVVLDGPVIDRIGATETRKALASALARTGPQSRVSLHPVGVAGNDLSWTLSPRPSHAARERNVLATSFLFQIAVAPYAPDRNDRLEDVFANLSRSGGCPRIILLATDFPDTREAGMVRDAALDLSGSVVLALLPEEAGASRAGTRWRRRVESGGGVWFAARTPADIEAALGAAAIFPWREGDEAPTSHR